MDEIIRESGKADDCLEVLLLADETYPASVVQEHVDALRFHSRHRVTVRSPMNVKKGWRSAQWLIVVRCGGSLWFAVVCCGSP